MSLIYYHIIAFFAGFVLDAILGDPYSFPHPVKFMGKLISWLENRYLGEKPKPAEKKAEEEKPEILEEIALEEEKSEILEEMALEEEKQQILEEKAEDAKKQDSEEERKKKRELGRQTVLIVLFCTVLITDILLIGAYTIHPILGCVVEAIMTYQVLAAKCLVVESMKVYQALTTGTIEEARKAVSMIVGRDTEQLDEAGVTRAAVETVAENASDGVIAPMLYLAIGGPILGLLYKAINTMDSMIGYKNERYLDFGRAAAKLDDIVNFVPSRISAWLMILACPFLGDDYIASEAKRIYLRDRSKHSSPNSAQTESACAGALGIKLGGDASYFGKMVSKPELGDGRRRIQAMDIPRANRLMYGAAILCELLCIGITLAIAFTIRHFLMV